MISTDCRASKFESIEDDASLLDAVPQAQIERNSLARAVYISIQNTNVPTSLSPIHENSEGEASSSSSHSPTPPSSPQHSDASQESERSLSSPSSSSSWQIYEHTLKNEEAELDLATCFNWMQHLHETEKSELRTEVLVAESTIGAREVEMANNLEDYQAEVDNLRDERDEARTKLARRKTQLKSANVKIKGIENEAKALLDDRSSLQEEAETWKLRASEAMTITQDLKKDLNRIRSERDLLTSTNDQARLILDLYNINNALLARQSEQDGEIQKLRADFRSARLEATYMHAINMGHLMDTEDHPEKSAHLDGLLKRKDEIHDDLLKRFSECVSQRAEEQKQRNIDCERFSGALAGLQRENANLKEENGALNNSREGFQKHNEEILRLLAGNLFPENLSEALNEEYELLKQDNAFLIQLVRSREVRAEEKAAETSPLKVEIIELKDTLETSKNEQRGLQARTNELEARKYDLEISMETLQGSHEQQIKSLETEIQDERQKLQDIVKDTSSPSIQRFVEGKNREIDQLRTRLANVESQAVHFHDRAVEMGADFDPVFCMGQIADWNSAVVWQRMKIAERMLRELEAKLKAMGIWDEVRGDIDPRHRELDEVDNFLRHL